MKNTLYANGDKLDEKIKSSGLKVSYICEQLGISRNGFYRKKKGEIPFRKAEVFTICTLLEIVDADEKMDIFFPNFVEK